MRDFQIIIMQQKWGVHHFKQKKKIKGNGESKSKQLYLFSGSTNFSPICDAHFNGWIKLKRTYPTNLFITRTKKKKNQHENKKNNNSRRTKTKAEIIYSSMIPPVWTMPHEMNRPRSRLPWLRFS